MLPFGLPLVAPAVSLAELLGPLAPLALIPVAAGLAVLLGMLALRPLGGHGTRFLRIPTIRRSASATPLRAA